MQNMAGTTEQEASEPPSITPEQLAMEQGPDGLLHVLERNRYWAEAKKSVDPNFFKRMIPGQAPPYFLIGCVDSRILVDHLFDLPPGHLLVHRNIANQTRNNDPAFLSSLQFAIEELHVEHIIIKGHYGCGGVAAAMGEERDDEIGEWIAPIRETHKTHAHEIDECSVPARRLAELNVIRQVQTLARNPIVLRTWENGGHLVIHGWAYGIGDGLVRPVCAPVTGPQD